MKCIWRGMVVMLVLASSCLQAQSFRGGFGFAYFGPVWNFSRSIETGLRRQPALGDGLNMIRLETLSGGGGYGLFANGLLLGGSGMGYTVNDATRRGQVNMSMGSGFVNDGYLTTRRPNLLVFPYIGVGGYETKAEIRNGTSEFMWIGGHKVPAAEYLYLHNQGMSFEAGYALHLFTFSVPGQGSAGGFIIGLQIGAYFFVSTEDWHVETTDDVMLEFSKPFVLAPYLRLAIGGGGFKASGNP